METLGRAIELYGKPLEILTDHGTQFFSNGKELDKKAREDKEFLQKIKNETADVFFGCLAMADHLLKS